MELLWSMHGMHLRWYSLAWTDVTDVFHKCWSKSCRQPATNLIAVALIASWTVCLVTLDVQLLVAYGMFNTV